MTDPDAPAVPPAPGVPGLVSVIMLTYNRAPYIAEAIESALSQTYRDFELIIIDDGSTDDTAAVVAKFSDPRISYRRDNVNRGLFARRRESLTLVRGEFVAILDSDDVWIEPEKLARQVAYLREHLECAVVGTFAALIDSDGKRLGVASYHTTDKDIRRCILIRNQFANSSVLMRAEHLRQTVGYRDFAPTEDLELFLQLGRVGAFANLPFFGLAHRLHQGGESARKARLAKEVLKVIACHQDAYPGALWGALKMRLLFLLAKLGIK
jgi:glycosyltransferase involved in cell wall biosynthesis